MATDRNWTKRLSSDIDLPKDEELTPIRKNVA
ncbi:hypothetical protein FHS25_006671 [Rhizobium laguerreae]|uniref:Uncharacterized protein n=1 Tax=Rhizobium laguerreae TaxID=1076926 RepID=A0ABR6GIN7_9HYPH|nr:hypothetical protein [Rhizobium laguerreae]